MKSDAFRDLVMIVTGASAGIGRALALPRFPVGKSTRRAKHWLCNDYRQLLNRSFFATEHTEQHRGKRRKENKMPSWIEEALLMLLKRIEGQWRMT